MAERREVLEETLAVLRDSLTEAPADKRAPIAAQIRATLADLDSLPPVAGAAPGGPAAERTGLVDFQQRLAERQSASKAARPAAR
jgi:hypothetical protein